MQCCSNWMSEIATENKHCYRPRAVMEELEATKDEVQNMKKPEINIDTTESHKVIPAQENLREHAAKFRRTVHRAEAATHELVQVKSECRFKLSQSTSACVQLADRVFSRSFLQDLCDEISEQAIWSYLESDRNCHMIERRMENKTLEDIWKQPHNRKRSGDGLPEELVERIISLIPFPWLFKARILSRSWVFKFPVQSVRSSQPSFQNMISSVSSRWTTYYPVLLTKKKSILCFDRASSLWRSMGPLSYLPSESYSEKHSNCMATTAGPLICLSHFCALGYQAFVSNVITKSWRKLGLPKKFEAPTHVRLLMEADTNSYKIILVWLGTLKSGKISIRVYDSSLRTWTKKKLNLEVEEVCQPQGCIVACPCSAYLDKKLQFLYLHSNSINRNYHTVILCTYEVENGAWLTTGICNVRLVDIEHSAILVCKDKLMLAAWARDCDWGLGPGNVHNDFEIFEFDWSDPKQLKEVCKGPPHSIDLHREGSPFWYVVEFGSDPHFIYFRLRGTYSESCHPADSRILSYNLETNVWELCPPEPVDWHSGKQWMNLAFEPGLNPFASV